MTGRYKVRTEVERVGIGGRRPDDWVDDVQMVAGGTGGRTGISTPSTNRPSIYQLITDADEHYN